MPVTSKFNLGETVLSSLRKVARMKRVSRWENSKGEPERYKSNLEHVACMALYRAFQANDWTLTGPQISKVHEDVFGSSGQSPTKLVVIANNKMEQMPLQLKIGDLIPKLLADEAYDDWIIESVGKKGNTSYVCYQHPDYDKYYGQDWVLPVAAANRKRTNRVAIETVTVVQPATPQEIAANFETTSDSGVPEEFVFEGVGTIPEDTSETTTIEVEVEEPTVEAAEKPLSKNEKRRLAKAKAKAAAEQAA